jgi:hypothetical protein
MTTRARAVVLILALGVVVVAGLTVAFRLLDERTEQPERLIWSGPIRPEFGRLPVQPMAHPGEFQEFEWADGSDTRIGAVDISDVHAGPEGRTHWRIQLAERPPKAAGLDRANRLISYGLVFETTGDGIADIVVGINNDAPRPGDFRVWVTDVATGQTEEQIGPPYGFPVEFSHPDEAQPGDEAPGPATVMFTFIRGSSPPGLTGASPFYAWASITAGTEVAAWDYAPDASWLTSAPLR